MKPPPLTLAPRPPAPDLDWEWWDDAACLPFPTGWWYADPHVNRHQTAKAIQICNDCPVKAECLAYAHANNEHGIWGGVSDEERRRMRSLGRR